MNETTTMDVDEVVVGMRARTNATEAFREVVRITYLANGARIKLWFSESVGRSIWSGDQVQVQGKV